MINYQYLKPKNMKTRIFLMMVLAVALLSCQKEKNNTATEQDVTFSANQITPDVGLKSTADAFPCKPEIADYAWVKIKDASNVVRDYYPALFTLEGKLYAQAIKLPVGAYAITQFVLYKNVDGATIYDGNDIIVFGTPNSGTPYAEYVSHPMDYTFAVEAFKKAEIAIDVLCFQDHEYTSFGFNWFHLNEIVIREQCFFGDICLNGNGGVPPAWVPGDYTGSLYADNGLQEDEVAIFEVKLLKNGVAVPNSPFSNAAWYGIGQPLCVVYPDNLGITEVFTFEIWVYVKSLTGFDYQLYQTFTATDDQMIEAGADGIVDFAIGTCSPASQYIWPWLLPQ
jgi:hypothetical protein